MCVKTVFKTHKGLKRTNNTKPAETFRVEHFQSTNEQTANSETHDEKNEIQSWLLFKKQLPYNYVQFNVRWIFCVLIYL